MKIDYFKIPEIKVSYKDNVNTTERFQIKCSEDTVQIFKIAFGECMQHHEEAYVIFMNRSNRVLGFPTFQNVVWSVHWLILKSLCKRH